MSQKHLQDVLKQIAGNETPEFESQEFWGWAQAYAFRCCWSENQAYAGTAGPGATF